VALLLANLGCSAALAATSLGQAVAVVPSVSGHGTTGDVTILTGADLYEGETISTREGGQVQIVFTDDTHMVIGPGSEVVIERYLMRNQNTVSDFAVKAVGGTFRWITGDSPKSAYKISTPTGTIGIRGTEFDFWVKKASGETGLLLYGGAVNMCGFTGGCVSIKNRCSMAIMGDGKPTHLLDDKQRSKSVGSNLPYVLSQSRLKRDFHVMAPSACLAKVDPVTTGSVPLLFQKILVPPTQTPPPVLPPPDTPPPVQDPPPVDGGHNNNGYGNGSDPGDGGGGVTEPANPRSYNGNLHANPNGGGLGGG
jgi:hypothetical protein